MFRSSSQMARIQDFLTTEGCEGDSSRLVDLTSSRKAEATSMKHHVRRTQGCHLEGTLHIVAEVQACLTSRPLCALSSDPFNPLFPGHL